MSSPDKVASTRQPMISVVVSTYNRCVSLQQTLELLTNQDGGQNFFYLMARSGGSKNNRRPVEVRQVVAIVLGELFYLLR